METTKKALLTRITRQLELGNLLLSIGTAGLMVIGVFEMSLPVLITLAGAFVIIVVFGKYISELEDDAARLKLYEEHVKAFFTGHHDKISRDSGSGVNSGVPLELSEDSNKGHGDSVTDGTGRSPRPENKVSRESS